MPEPLSPCLGVQEIYKYASPMRAIEEAVTAWALSAGVHVTATSRLRTCRQQEALYIAGRTRVPPTQSQHEFGWACDLVPGAGYERYQVTRAETIAWLAALGTYYGAGTAIAESDHCHLAYWSASTWRAFLQARAVGASLPVPGRRAPRR